MKTVMKKMIDRCRIAFQAKQPLIFIDTEEQELVRELALQCDLVDLVRKPSPHGRKHGLYYEFIDAIAEDENGGKIDVRNCINLYDTPAELVRLTKEGHSLNNSLQPQKAMPASIFTLHMTQGSWKQASEQENSMVAVLRYYVKHYLLCPDENAPLRNSCVFLYGDSKLMPAELMQYTEIVPVEYPDQDEIASIVKEMTEACGPSYEFELEDDYKTVARELAGFSLMDTRRTLRKLLWTDHVNSKPVLHDKDERKKRIMEIKEQALLKSGDMLELVKEPEKKKQNTSEPAAQENQLGGMGSFRKYVEETIKDKILYPYLSASKKGTPPPKGILLVGVPGCGKSEAAKILHRIWEYKLPMLKLEVDRLMASKVGESEKYMREALKQAEAMSPCILWIDELDKGFSGAASSGSSDGGTFKRMFGRLLTWMQENKSGAFIFATANNIGDLPDEFFRNGRYDARFSVFMPTHEECKAIFREHMHRAERLQEKTALDYGEPVRQLFDSNEKTGCFSDSCMDQVMALFTEALPNDPNGKKDVRNPVGVKFVSGADICLIVNTALDLMTDAQTDHPLSADDWINLVREAIQSPFVCTQGGSSSGLDKIAECYVRLLRGNFVPAAAKDQVLFRKENYISINGVYKYEDPNGCSSPWDYDNALYNAILQRIPDAAEYVEKQARNGR
ncbi:MAG: AAA family ATPase [Anaerotignum sp.]|nr:AAA family ATPase [Anaerotignum sp.]